MIPEKIATFLQAVTRIMGNSPQQRRFDSNYKATAKKLSISLMGVAIVAFGTSAAAQAATFVSTNDDLRKLQAERLRSQISLYLILESYSELASASCKKLI
ncbi:hypothetical protein [Microseira wollei]|uniref:Uncharacterized protein n=1 Tax=Microseira wollei NIES-4236 TaxID=2530354 RepID=A0AAV3XJ17_9CYAN|nr:hypothetical protein [Microseira wollei]GET40417.1 hypothetical protein MiSe_52260 [Microseira wollei NIES-4236]